MFGRKQRRTDTRDSQSEQTQSRGASRRGRRRGASERTASNQQLQQRLKEHGIQPKLKVSEPDDEYEKEAERVADAVMRMSPDGFTVDPRKDDEIQRSGSLRGPTVQGAAEQRIESLEGGGKPLSRSTRSFFEPRFGADFGHVRVHTGPQADAAVRSVDAKAFTKGSSIAFASGNYKPKSRSGKKLLAHELAHVKQQGAVKPLSDDSTDSDFTPGAGQVKVDGGQRRTESVVHRQTPDDLEQRSQKATLPSVRTMDLGFKATTFMAMAGGQPHIAALLYSLHKAAVHLGDTLAVGLSGGAAGGLGLELGAGYAFLPSGAVGLYGGASSDFGAQLSLGIDVTWTHVYGGINTFAGEVGTVEVGVHWLGGLTGTGIFELEGIDREGRPILGDQLGYNVEAGLGFGADFFTSGVEATGIL